VLVRRLTGAEELLAVNVARKLERLSKSSPVLFGRCGGEKIVADFADIRALCGNHD
jgi:hypothetical protein